MNNEQFQDSIREGLVLVDFFATWCGPCKMLKPVLQEIEAEGTKVIYIDVDKDVEIRDSYGVMAVPTLLVFVDGQLKGRTGGYKSKAVIQELLELSQ